MGKGGSRLALASLGEPQVPAKIGGGGVGDGFRMIKPISFIVHFITIITSAPRQIIRH